MFTRRGLFISLLLVLIVVLGACQPVVQQAPADQPAAEEAAADQPAEEGEEAAESAAMAAEAPAGAPDSFKIGVVAFLSGGAAAPFGVPAQNAANMMIEEINNGRGPAPYDTPGIAGVPMEAVFIDEAGGADQQVSEFRRLFLEENVDLVVGYISSTDCLAVAPVADEIQGLTIAFDCGTARLFEEEEYDYMFRTNAHQTIDSIGAAHYLLEKFPDAQTIAGINQNYSWGQDSWTNFRDAMLQLKPDVEVVNEQFPAYGAGEYSAAISALLQAEADVIHSSFWGADLDGLLIQASPRGLFDQSTLVLSVGEYALPSLGEQIPQGTVIGGHGPHGPMAPDNEYNQWLVENYQARYDARPTYPAYHMSQAIFGIKAAIEKAVEEQGEWPSDEEIIAAFEYLEFPTPSGPISMAIGGGHQAVEPAGFAIAGEMDPETGERTLTEVVVYPVACVNPPDGVTTQEWIDEGFPGAECP